MRKMVNKSKTGKRRMKSSPNQRGHRGKERQRTERETTTRSEESPWWMPDQMLLDWICQDQASSNPLNAPGKRKGRTRQDPGRTHTPKEPTKAVGNRCTAETHDACQGNPRYQGLEERKRGKQGETTTTEREKNSEDKSTTKLTKKKTCTAKHETRIWGGVRGTSRRFKQARQAARQVHPKYNTGALEEWHPDAGILPTRHPPAPATVRRAYSPSSDGVLPHATCSYLKDASATLRHSPSRSQPLHSPLLTSATTSDPDSTSTVIRT